MAADTVEIKHRQLADGCTVLDIEAENFTYPQTAVLKTYVAKLIEQGQHFFVLNVNAVRLVDSYGLATIVATLKLIKEKGGALALYGLNETFSHLVEVTQLHRVLEVWPSESQASYYLTTQMKSSAHH